MKNIPRICLILESSRSSGRDLMRGISKYASIHGPWAFDISSPLWISKSYKNTWFKYIRKWNPNGIIMREIEGMDDIY
ncbi:MAG: hypothetical protein KAS96_01140, partial [Planctomycetes bacterium]|nr:hypothetical protein [Planctomycetota bacterium]